MPNPLVSDFWKGAFNWAPEQEPREASGPGVERPSLAVAGTRMVGLI